MNKITNLKEEKINKYEHNKLLFLVLLAETSVKTALTPIHIIHLYMNSSVKN
jgi:hypothetical protein